jgi:hypothetical protein
MKGNKTAELSFDANVIWEEVRRAADRAPKWASTDPPYPVKEAFVRPFVAEKQVSSVAPTKSQAETGPSNLTGPGNLSSPPSRPSRPSFRERIARIWRG